VTSDSQRAAVGLRDSEDWLKRIPLIGGAADPVAMVALGLLGLVAITLVWLGPHILRGDRDARSHIIQLLGLVAVLVGGYFTARQLMAGHTQKYAERLGAALEQLGSDKMPVRLGAIRLLEGLAAESKGLPGDKRGRAVEEAWNGAIADALAELGKGDPAEPDVSLAQAVLLRKGLAGP
jgi:hypothetical protein